MTDFLFANLAMSYITENLSQGSTVIYIPPSDAEAFPQPSGDQVFVGFLQDGVQPPEIVWVSLNPFDGSLHVQRGKEGTAALSWQAGTVFFHSVSKESLEWLGTGGAGPRLDALEHRMDLVEIRMDDLETEFSDFKASVDVKFLDVQSQIEQANASVQVLSTAFTDLNYAFAQLEFDVNAAVATNTAQIQVLATAVATNTQAIATLETNVTAQFNNAFAQITAVQTAQVDFEAATATNFLELTADFTGLQTTVAGQGTQIVAVNAGLTALQTVVADNYSATSSAITTLNANYGTVNAGLTNEILVRASADSALASQITTINLDIDGIEVDIANEVTARIDGDTASATAIDNLSVTVAGNTSSITTLASTTASIDGRLKAVYGLQLNVDGKITGFSSENDGVTSTFGVQADKFQITDGASATTPFTYTGGVLSAGSLKLTGSIDINNLFIVTEAGAVTLRSGTSGARLEMTNSLISVYDSGGTLRVRMGIW